MWSYFRSAKCAILSFGAGILIDLDHPLDYMLTNNFRLDIRDMYRSYLAVSIKKAYLIFHSYELIILLWLSIGFFSLSNAWKAAAIGFTQHIVFDALYNRINALAYFFTYRLINNFDAIKLITRKKE